MNKVLPTTGVGSYPQPNWLIDRSKLGSKVPRVRAPEIWRIAQEHLEEAQDDATVLAIRDMERAGVDIITDGEMRRESYSNRFATALEGIDLDKPGHVQTRSGAPTPVPRVVGKLRRSRPVEVRDMEFLRRHTERPAKITLPGPFTMAQQAQNKFYPDVEALAMDLAVAVKHQKPTGYSFLAPLADSIATQISIEAAQPKLDLGILADLARKQIMLGVIDLSDPHVETAEEVAARIRAGLRY